MAYASFMILVYPVGIPAFYSYVLYKNKSGVTAVDRDFDPNIAKIAFLWENYEQKMWWWEVLECGRRLTLSGVLVFVAQGTPSQILVALLVSVITSGLYIHWRPFERDSDNDLAIATQSSLLFTLLAALLRKAGIDESEGYNQTVFGLIFIFINCIGIVMVIAGLVVHPLHFFTNGFFGEKHAHDGALRGMNVDLTRDKAGFVDHFVRVAKSNTEEAGWEPYVNKREKWETFLEYSGAVVERRCSEGRGFIDEMRAVFIVTGWKIDRVKKWFVNESRDIRENDVESHDIGGQNSSEERRVFYLARRMKGGYVDRDFLLESFEGELEDGFRYVVQRSLDDENLHSLKMSHAQRRVRASVRYMGCILHACDGGKSTRVVYVENLDPGGFWKGAILKKVIPKMLRDRIDELLLEVDYDGQQKMFVGLGEEEVGGGGSFEMTNVMSAAGGKGLTLGGGLETIASPMHMGLGSRAGQSASKACAKKQQGVEKSVKASNLKVNSQGLLAISKGMKGPEEDDDDDAKPPSIPPPAPRPNLPPPPSQPPPAASRQRCKWRRLWDEGEQAHYFENEEEGRTE